MVDVVKVRSPEELVAVIPHLIGFTPDNSMVCLAFGDGPTSRIDLPQSPEELGQSVETLREVYLERHPVRGVALLAFGENESDALGALDALSQGLVSSGNGPDVGPVLWVNGDEWMELISGERGTVSQSARMRLDAEFALLGRTMPAQGREDLVKSMRGDTSGVAECLSQAKQAVVDSGGSEREAQWLVEQLEEFKQTREYVSDPVAARVLAGLSRPNARDAVVLSMRCENAEVYSEFWQDLVRRAPAEVRDSAATVLATSLFLQGKGAHAQVALSELSERNHLSVLLEGALTKAVNPREWDHLMSSAGESLLQQSMLGADGAPSHHHAPMPPGLDVARTTDPPALGR